MTATSFHPTSRTYLQVAAALLALLLLTVGAAYVNLGPLNTTVAMAISAAKAGLIMAFFMHLRAARPLILLTAAAGFFWLAIMLILAASDFAARG